MVSIKEPLSMPPFEVHRIYPLVMPPHVPSHNDFMSCPKGMMLIPLYIAQGPDDILSLHQNLVLIRDPLIMGSQDLALLSQDLPMVSHHSCRLGRLFIPSDVVFLNQPHQYLEVNNNSYGCWVLRSPNDLPAHGLGLAWPPVGYAHR